MKFIYNDGGRSNYFKGSTGDCVTRAICNATGKDYKEVYDAINELAKNERTGKRKRGVSNARTGVYKVTIKKYIEEVLGWLWHPTMQIGQGCKVHLKEDELPSGTLIVSVSTHLTCVKDKVIYDTYDCSREDNRCVYGYWTAPTQEELEFKRKQQEELLLKKQKQAEMKAKIKKVKEKYNKKIKTLEKALNKEIRAIEKQYN